MKKKNFFSRNKGKIFAVIFLLILICLVVGLVKFTTEKSGKKVAGVDDLPGSRIGVQLGTTGDTYASDYEGDKEGTKVKKFTKGADAIMALTQKKVDCVIIDEQPALSYVAKNPELSILEEEFTVEDYAICLAKGNTALEDQINNALNELKSDGTLDNIISYYIDDDYEGEKYESPEAADYSNGVLTMATNAQFPPYEYYGDGGSIEGIDVDIATAIADKLGMKLKIDDMEFDSVVVAVQTGKDMMGMAGMTVTEDRLKNVDFSDSYTQSKQVIIVKTGSSTSSSSFKDKFKQCFIENHRYQYILKGLKNTIIITLLAGIFGILLGFLTAIIRVANDRDDEKSFGIKILNVIAKIYLTVFRGTPMMVQLLIMYYVIFASVNIDPLPVAIIAFSLNSGAYVAEAVRAGIISIPVGQFEAGRSLGFNYSKTMLYIIMPQAIRNALPAMCNEFIALLKESSIVGYIGLIDITRAGDIIRSNTYEAMVPLVAVALIYLIIVMIMTALVGKLERKLKKDER